MNSTVTLDCTTLHILKTSSVVHFTVMVEEDRDSEDLDKQAVDVIIYVCPCDGCNNKTRTTRFRYDLVNEPYFCDVCHTRQRQLEFEREEDEDVQ
jgi:hypothetical protein